MVSFMLLHSTLDRLLTPNISAHRLGGLQV